MILSLLKLILSDLTGYYKRYNFFIFSLLFCQAMILFQHMVFLYEDNLCFVSMNLFVLYNNLGINILLLTKFFGVLTVLLLSYAYYIIIEWIILSDEEKEFSEYYYWLRHLNPIKIFAGALFGIMIYNFFVYYGFDVGIFNSFFFERGLLGIDPFKVAENFFQFNNTINITNNTSYIIE